MSAKKIQALYNKNEKPKCYTTVYYDAWTYDNHDDPILSLVYAASQNRQGADLNGNPSHVTVAAAAVFDALTGKNLTSVFKEFENAKGKDMLAEIKDAEYVKVGFVILSPLSSKKRKSTGIFHR